MRELDLVFFRPNLLFPTLGVSKKFRRKYLRYKFRRKYLRYFFVVCSTLMRTVILSPPLPLSLPVLGTQQKAVDQREREREVARHLYISNKKKIRIFIKKRSVSVLKDPRNYIITRKNHPITPSAKQPSPSTREREKGKSLDAQREEVAPKLRYGKGFCFLRVFSGD